MTLADGIVGLIIILLVVGVFKIILSGKMSDTHAGIANLTVFHDFQPKGKQEAVEIIIEQDSGKNWIEQSNGLDVNKNN